MFIFHFMSNLTCEDIHVNGRIIFGDNTSQETSANPLFSKCAQIERNPSTSSTSILNDSLVVNNSLSVGNQLTSNFMNTNGLAFLQDLDPNGIPFVQNGAFSSILKQKIIDAKNGIDSVIPDIIDPPNKKIKLDNGQPSTSHTSIEIGYETIIIQPPELSSTNNIQIINQDTTKSNLISMDHMVISDGNMGNQATLSLNGLSQAGPGVSCLVAKDAIQQTTENHLINIQDGLVYIGDQFGPVEKVEITKTEIHFTDYGNGFSSSYTRGQLVLQDFDQETTPSLSLKNEFNHETLYTPHSIIADGHQNFRLKNPNTFMFTEAPIGYKLYYVEQDGFIEKYHPFVVMDSGITFIRFRDPSEYVTSTDSATGFSVIVTNLNGQDVEIETAGTSWYSHNAQMNGGGTITITKYSTCRITLVYSPSYGNTFWAVSQF